MIAKNAVQRAESYSVTNDKGVNTTLSSSTPTKIFNLHSNDEREVKDIKVVSNEEYDKYGKKVVNKYVQYIIIGKNRTWPDFMPTDEFKKLNPRIKVEGLI